jgi:hypothetical protein
VRADDEDVRGPTAVLLQGELRLVPVEGEVGEAAYQGLPSMLSESLYFEK